MILNFYALNTPRMFDKGSKNLHDHLKCKKEEEFSSKFDCEANV